VKKRIDWAKILLRILTYVLVAVVTCVSTMYLMLQQTGGKLTALRFLINNCFIGEVDQEALDDGAAAGMVDALPDRWSYYIPASEMLANTEHMENAYVGVGITIINREDNKGFDIIQVEPTGGAKEAGVLPGDILVAVEGQRVSEIGMDGARALIRGKEDTQVNITVERDGQELGFTVTRKQLLVQVAAGQMLEGNVGYITIANFNDRCAQETIERIEELIAQGATSLLFDVRFNPGGYKDELVKLLDYLLPEGDLFRSQLYTGEEAVDTSDAKCLEMPMAVLVNGDSYSAAEFFAAALDEYDWAVLVGEPTVGKGYFQSTFDLGDGSAVALSVGKYFTPNGRCLEDEGGLTPEVTVEVDQETASKIYAGVLEPTEDPQIQAALEALKK
jgi:carboxyl-terminal processing protease